MRFKVNTQYRWSRKMALGEASKRIERLAIRVRLLSKDSDVTDLAYALHTLSEVVRESSESGVPFTLIVTKQETMFDLTDEAYGRIE